MKLNKMNLTDLSTKINISFHKYAGKKKSFSNHQIKHILYTSKTYLLIS